ncbi:pilin, partial [Candidatus Omnitrophota bacterium]
GFIDEDCPHGQVCLDNPLGSDVTPQTFIGDVIRGILGVVGSLALALFIYGGFLWMTAAGNAEQVAKGKNTLLWATLGLIIIFSSYALVRFVIYEVIQAPSG